LAKAGAPGRLLAEATDEADDPAARPGRLSDLQLMQQRDLKKQPSTSK
jgi:hypothetical protein